MNQKEQVQRLRALTGLILDMRLSDLRAAARAKQESLDRLAALHAPQATDLPPIAAAQADILYQRWAEQRRAEINLILARQTAEVLEARAMARRAFGQTEALRGLAEKTATPPKAT